MHCVLGLFLGYTFGVVKRQVGVFLHIVGDVEFHRAVAAVEQIRLCERDEVIVALVDVAYRRDAVAPEVCAPTSRKAN